MPVQLWGAPFPCHVGKRPRLTGDPPRKQFFYRHPLLQQYKWYWRVEPDVHFHCDIDFDPFLFMEDHNKTYGASPSPLASVLGSTR